MKYCPSCGKRGVEGMSFCPQCGQKLVDFDLEGKQKYDHKPERHGGKMRKAAGIILIITGLLSLIFFHGILMDWIVPSPTFENAHLIGVILLLDIFLSLGLIMGGGICALRKKHWWWALSGAIFSIFVGIFIFNDPVLRQFWSPLEVLMGTVAVVFVCLRRRDWSESQA